jgi:hypothetical protein
MDRLLPPDSISRMIQWIRGEKVILDRDLAVLYGVETRALKQAVRRNPERFPEDFMFELSHAEFENWRSQFVISKADKQGLRHQPMAFTEQGVAMLSSVLRGPRAIEVNIAIMRTFVQLRRLMDSNRDLARRIEALEKKYDKQFSVVFEAIKKLVARDADPPPRRRIGFDPGE